MLNEYYDDPVVVLVDDWDTPLFTALRYGYYDKIAYIIRRMVEMAVDGCGGIRFSLLTSSMHIPIGGGYFDPYNYGYNSIFDRCYEKMAGFTESETKVILDYYGMRKNAHQEEAQPIPCQMINCFCMYSDYTPLTLEEWVEYDQKRRNK